MSTPKWVFKRSDGKVMTFGDGTFAILAMSGIDEIKPEIFRKKKARGDGDVITGYRLPARDLMVKAEIIDNRLNDAMRTVLNSFFSHSYTYDVYITYTGETRYAKGCRLMRFYCPAANVYDYIKPQVNMLNPDAYFLSVDEFGKNIAGTGGSFGFPYVNLVGSSTPFGVFLFARNVEIYNDGDAEAYPKAVFTFRGEVTNPYVSMAGSYVKVVDTFVEGDTLIMNAADKSITKNGANISTKIDKGSRWNDLVFQIGDNTISYDAEYGNNLVDVTIYFNKRYVGV